MDRKAGGVSVRLVVTNYDARVSVWLVITNQDVLYIIGRNAIGHKM